MPGLDFKPARTEPAAPPRRWDRATLALLVSAAAIVLAGAALLIVLLAGFLTAPLPPQTQAGRSPQRAPAATQPVRSPMPLPGETLAQPLPPRLLADPDSQKPPWQVPAPGQVVPWDRAGMYLGQTIVVEGRVTGGRNLGNLCFLNFTPDREAFYVVVYKEAFPAWPASPEVHFAGKTIRVTGQVTTHGGSPRPQIQVRAGSQITIVE